MLEAIIFDMDGVLSDSEWIYDEALDAVMSRFGFKMSLEEMHSFRGVSSGEMWEILADRYSAPATAHELLAMEKDFVDERLMRGEIQPIPFAFALMRSLKESGLKIAVATSNFGYRATKMIEQNDVKTLVDVLVSCEDVERAKPRRFVKENRFGYGDSIFR